MNQADPDEIRNEDIFEHWPTRIRWCFGKVGLDLIQALIPAALVVSLVVENGWGNKFLCLFLSIFAIAAVMYLSGLNSEHRDSNMPRIMIACLAVSAFLTGLIGLVSPHPLLALVLIFLNFGSARVARKLDSYILETPRGVESD